MASSQTTNYGLNQWAAEDRIIREEFNEDNAKIDAALAAMQTAQEETDTALAAKASQAALNTVSASVPKIVAGTYTGNEAETRTISLGFTPKAVLVCSQNYGVSDGDKYSYGGLAVTGSGGGYNEAGVSIVTNGFKVAYTTQYGGFQGGTTYYIRTNADGEVYHYIAIA